MSTFIKNFREGMAAGSTGERHLPHSSGDLSSLEPRWRRELMPKLVPWHPHECHGMHAHKNTSYMYTGVYIHIHNYKQRKMLQCRNKTRIHGSDLKWQHGSDLKWQIMKQSLSIPNFFLNDLLKIWRELITNFLMKMIQISFKNDAISKSF